jgi:hypothetical protein
MEWIATILGQPRSKANTRRQLKNPRSGKMFSAKNEDCLVYAESVKAQALACRPPRLLEGPLSFRGTLYYPDKRSDLDPSLLADALQGVVFKNDRQIKHWDIWHGIDPDNPRAEIVIAEIG